MNGKMALKVFGVIGPLAVALTGLFYGDVTPFISDVCKSLLPSIPVVRPSTTVIEADAGAAR